MYIERDKLLRQLEIVPLDGRYIDIEAVEGLVRDMPAAEVAPVVRGEWIRAAAYNDGVLNTAYCSVCKNYLPISNWDYHNFAPTAAQR